jgi:pyrroline-5-carboxylate reductase
VDVGLIGAGNLAWALARGWGRPLRVADLRQERAEALVAEVGGEVCRSNRELAMKSELVVLCTEPGALRAVASDLLDSASPVASPLTNVTLEQLRAACPGRPLFRLMPNLAVEVGHGVIGWAEPVDNPPELSVRVRDLFAEIGFIAEVSESLIPPLNAVAGVATAYVALLIEAHVDAGVRRGLPQELASQLAVLAFRGGAELVAARQMDTLGVRRAVTTPGGYTARGLAALEAAGVRSAFQAAIDAVMAP